MSLSRQLLKNIFSTWVAFAIRVVVTFFFTPFITSKLGGERYGAWVIVFATIDYLSMIDFGMKQSLVRYISKYLSEKRPDKINETLNTATAIYIGLGIIVLIASLVVVANIQSIVKLTTPEMIAEVQATLLVVSLHVTVYFFLLPFASTLGAFHRFDLSNMIGLSEELLRSAALVTLILAGYGLVALAWAMFILSVLRQVVCIITLKRIHPETLFNLRLATREMAGTLLHYSKISFVITIMWLIIFRADPYILGGVVSVAAAGIFAPATQLFHYLRNLVNAIGTPLVPAISHLEARAELNKLGTIYLKGVRYITFVAVFFAVGCILYAQAFVDLWLAPEFHQAGAVMVILAVPAAIYLPQIVGNSILFGVDRHRAILKILLVEAAMKIGLGLYLVREMGLLGLAWGTGIPQALLYGFVFPVVMKRAVGVSLGKFYRTYFLSAALAVAVGAPLGMALRALIPPDDWGSFFINVGALVLLAVPVGWGLVEPDDRVRLAALIKRQR